MRSTLPASVLLFCAPFAVAQTFVVDAANGPGAHFTDIGPAVAAVPDGAVLVVRDGHYSSFGISGKSLTVLAGAAVTVGGITSALITINALSPTQNVVLRQVRTAMSNHAGIGLVACTNCQGRIHLDGVGQGPGGSTRLLIDQCAQVMVTSCSFVGGSNLYGAQVQNSDVVFVEANLRAGAANPGLIQSGGFTTLIATSVEGGLGLLLTPGGDGVVMQGGDLRVDGASSLRAGMLIASMPGRALAGVGNARVDPAAVLVGAAPLVAPSIALTSLAFPTVRASGGALGGAAQATLAGPAGALGVLWIGLPDASLPVPGWGVALWVSSGHILGFGLLSSPVAASVSVPNTPALLGGAFGWQGVTIDAAGAFEMANPVWFVLH